MSAQHQIVTVGDIGSKKGRLSTCSLLHGSHEAWTHVSFPHELGFLIRQGLGEAGQLDSTTAFSGFVRDLRAAWQDNTPKPRSVRRNLICTSAPGRAAQRESPGEFSLSTFQSSGILPIVLDGISEGRLMELAVWSEFDSIRAQLGDNPVIVHLHPGGMSLEINQSSDGTLIRAGCIENFGVVSEARDIRDMHDFEKLAQSLEHRLLTDDVTRAILKDVNEDTRFIISGSFARRIAACVRAGDGTLPRNGISRKKVRRLATRLINEFRGASLSPQEHFDHNGMLFTAALLTGFFQAAALVNAHHPKPRCIVSNAKLLHGLIEFRKRGSFNEHLIPEAIDEFMNNFFGSLYRVSHREDARVFGGFLSHALTSPRVPSWENAQRNMIIDLVVQLNALDMTDAPDNIAQLGRIPAHRLFAANRVPGLSRLFQEGIVAALNPEIEDPSANPSDLCGVNERSKWVPGFARSVSVLHQMVSIDPNAKTQVHVRNNGEVLEIGTASRAIRSGWEQYPREKKQMIAQGLSFQRVEFLG